MTRYLQQRARRAVPTVMLFGLLLGGLFPAGRANAAYYGGSRILNPFIYRAISLSAGVAYTFDTRANTSGSDPVMHVINLATGAQVAADDDGNGNLNPRVVFTPSSSGTYVIWVHSYSSSASGAADLYVNNVRQLTQAPFGGTVTTLAWGTNQHMFVTGTQRGAANDTMLFLLRNPTLLVQYDDDTGPNAYSVVTTNSAESGNSRAIYGLYPGSSGAGVLALDDCVGCTDTDSDGVNDALENAAGTDPNNTDTDYDGIPDRLELFGNDGYSFSEGDALSGTALRRNIYIEVDYMNGAGLGHNKQPYANLAADIATIFATDGNTRVDVLVDSALPWHRVISFDTCPAGSDCVLYNDVKSANFTTDIYKRLLFRYAVFANNVTASNNCAVGAAEYSGDDMIVSLDSTFGGCGRTFSAAEQRGAFMHLLGHTLGMGDSIWDQPVNNSVVYASTMNYRYMLSGDPGRTGVMASSYSFGLNGCVGCDVSPLQKCMTEHNIHVCNHDPNCDCDAADWNLISYIVPRRDPQPWLN